ncbi:MAG: hypothetical protein HYR91_06375 [Flavobacteriia bacterium]|nr:hypothetical protein [Flavobacteriia bacterium]
MKKILLMIGITLSFYSNSQTEISKNIPISPLTEVMLRKYYSEEEIQKIALVDDKLILMEYLYSKSFEIVAGQNYSQEQFLKIDVLNLRLLRKLDEDVVVFDEASGLNILLYSLNHVEMGKKNVLPSYKTNEEYENKLND